MKIAVHQMCSDIDPEINVATMVDAIGMAAEQGAAFYFAPEMSVLLDRDRKRAADKIADEGEAAAVQILCEAASRHGIWVHLGSLPVRSESGDGRLANRTLLIDDSGTIRARYDKIHLFDVQLSTGESWKESSAYAAGSEAALVTTPIGAMGLTICYDMRFPDLYSLLAKSGVDIITVPAAFTVPTGKAHWHSLLRARAIEAEAFVIAAAQSGTHADGRQTYGHSLVIDPWGEILLDMGEGVGVGFVDIDLARLAEVRAQIPVHANRRVIADKVRHF